MGNRSKHCFCFSGNRLNFKNLEITYKYIHLLFNKHLLYFYYVTDMGNKRQKGKRKALMCNLQFPREKQK